MGKGAFEPVSRLCNFGHRNKIGNRQEDYAIDDYSISIEKEMVIDLCLLRYAYTGFFEGRT